MMNYIKIAALPLTLVVIMGCEPSAINSRYYGEPYCNLLDSKGFKAEGQSNIYDGYDRFTCKSYFITNDYQIGYYVSGLENEIDTYRLEGTLFNKRYKKEYEDKYIEVASILYKNNLGDVKLNDFLESFKKSKDITFDTSNIAMNYNYTSPDSYVSLPHDTLAICLKKQYWNQYPYSECK